MVVNSTPSVWFKYILFKITKVIFKSNIIFKP